MPLKQPERIWKAAAYLRLSREDGEKTQSISIANQRELIYTYVERRKDICIVKEEFDDGYSGTTFHDRPGFMAVLGAVYQKEIDCVIVKDLSRFGRDYLDTGYYIEQLFSSRGIRFISINDGIDTCHCDAGDRILIPFTNITNDAYCRDISVKVRSQMDSKRKKGEFVGAFAAYGYQKSDHDKHKLIIDEYAAVVVREIFRLKIAGMSGREIAARLNGMGILSPAEYKNNCQIPYVTSFQINEHAKWSSTSVNRILQNPLYIGTLIQGKEGNISYKLHQRIKKPKQQWIIVENNHLPIIPRQIFEAVQRLYHLPGRRTARRAEENPLSGLVFCGYCGNGMNRKSMQYGTKKYCYYACNASQCTGNSIAESLLLELTRERLQALKAENESLSMDMALWEAFSNKTIVYDMLEKHLSELRQKHIQCRQYQFALEESLKTGLITHYDYIFLHDGYSRERQTLAGNILAVEAEMAYIREKVCHEKKEGICAMSRAAAVMGIEKVIVTNKNSIKLVARTMERRGDE